MQVVHKRDKRSSLTLPKVKREDGSKEDDSNDKENEKPSNIEKLPDIKHSNSPKGSPKKNRHSKHTGDKKEVTVKEGNANNGKGKRSPKKNKFVKRLSNGDRIQRTVPEDYYENGLLNNDDKQMTPEETILRLTGGVELVPLLSRRRRVGARTLPSSDVTRPPDESCQ